jgi:hypothetical protein
MPFVNIMGARGNESLERAIAVFVPTTGMTLSAGQNVSGCKEIPAALLTRQLAGFA